MHEFAEGGLLYYDNLLKQMSCYPIASEVPKAAVIICTQAMEQFVFYVMASGGDKMINDFRMPCSMCISCGMRWMSIVANYTLT